MSSFICSSLLCVYSLDMEYPYQGPLGHGINNYTGCISCSEYHPGTAPAPCHPATPSGEAPRTATLWTDSAFNVCPDWRE